jgi:hypothetical protein
MNRPLKIKKTQRKFYGKWLYKVSLRLEGCTLYRHKDLLAVIDFCNRDSFSQDKGYFSQVQSWDNRVNIYKVTTFLTNFPIDTWTKRIEGSILDLYSNDETFFNKCIDQFSFIVRNASAPVKDNIQHLTTIKQEVLLYTSKDQHHTLQRRTPQNHQA